jgi:peptidyl-tRNA hydrolase
LFDKKFNAEIAIAKDGKYMMIFAKPQTYMNLS